MPLSYFLSLLKNETFKVLFNTLLKSKFWLTNANVIIHKNNNAVWWSA